MHLLKRVTKKGWGFLLSDGMGKKDNVRDRSQHMISNTWLFMPRKSSTKWKGPMFQNQIKMHACHLTSKHCTYIFDSYRKILKEVQQELKKKEESLS
jgi:hypothetical protein